MNQHKLAFTRMHIPHDIVKDYILNNWRLRVSLKTFLLNYLDANQNN